jgi:hypothetical protein
MMACKRIRSPTARPRVDTAELDRHGVPVVLLDHPGTHRKHGEVFAGGYKGDAGITLKIIDRLTARPDLRIDGTCYDGAFRGTHIDHVMKRDMTALVPMHAGTAKPTVHGTVDCKCGDTHELWTHDGRLHERIILDTGETHLQPLPVRNIYARRNHSGIYRWYIEFAPLCGTLCSERIDVVDTDPDKGYNRTEHLRQHTKTKQGDGLYDRCYGWREDAESLNNTLDRTLYGGRMTAHSATRQHGVMIGFALGRNAIASFIHQRRKQPNPARGRIYPSDNHIRPTPHTDNFCITNTASPRAPIPPLPARRLA